MKNILCIALSALSLAYMPGLCAGVSAAAQEADINTYSATAEKRYSASGLARGGYLKGTEERDVYYSTKTVDEYKSKYGAPTFYTSLQGACAVNAGGNIIAYYDCRFDDLIPDYSPIVIGGKYYIYGNQNSAVDNMFNTLYNMMGTETIGTSVEGFKSGMMQYVTSKNHSINIASATGSYYNIDLNYLKSQLNADVPAAIFFDTFSLTPISGIVQNDGYDHIELETYGGYHIMFAYGYKDIVYYNADGSVNQRDTYLYVTTGFNGTRTALVDITRNCNVDDAYVLEVA